MDLRDVILLAVRWFHAVAAAMLVGGSAYQLLVVAPALRRASERADAWQRPINLGFKELVDLTLVVFVVSGGLLTFERLSSGAASTAYVVVLGVKIFLSVLVYRLAFQLRRSGMWLSLEARLLVGSGLLVILLASMLKTLYEAGLRG